MFLTEQTHRIERACLIIIYLTLYFSCKNGNTCPYKPVIWILRIRSYILWQKNITFVMGKIILQQRTRSLILSTHIRGLGRPRSIWLKSICPPGTNDIFFSPTTSFWTLTAKVVSTFYYYLCVRNLVINMTEELI